MSAMMKVLKAGDVVILASRLDRSRSQTPLSCTRLQHRLDARPTALGRARWGAGPVANLTKAVRRHEAGILRGGLHMGARRRVGNRAEWDTWIRAVHDRAKRRGRCVCSEPRKSQRAAAGFAFAWATGRARGTLSMCFCEKNHAACSSSSPAEWSNSTCTHMDIVIDGL